MVEVGGVGLAVQCTPGTLATLLGRIKGDEMVTIFTTGTCGDINHVDVTNQVPQKGHDEAARIGTTLAP